MVTGTDEEPAVASINTYLAGLPEFAWREQGERRWIREVHEEAHCEPGYRGCEFGGVYMGGLNGVDLNPFLAAVLAAPWSDRGDNEGFALVVDVNGERFEVYTWAGLQRCVEEAKGAAR
jgi:hypothetical protein